MLCSVAELWTLLTLIALTTTILPVNADLTHLELKTDSLLETFSESILSALGTHYCLENVIYCLQKGFTV